MDFVFAKQIAVSIGLGLLVGFQREWGPPHVAGIRTFALITVLGTICAHLGSLYGIWIVAAGLIAVTALTITAGIVKHYNNDTSPGITTSAAMLLMYSVGALLIEHMSAAVTVGGLTAVLLHWKKPLHTIVKKTHERDIHAIIQLVLIALVILPVLPNRSYGPYDVLNPFHIWLMVVLIVGISLLGYIASRLVEARAGALLAGILGGIISSTATTVSFSKYSRKNAEDVSLPAFVIMVASTIVFFRVVFEIGIVSPGTLQHIIPQLALMTAFMALMNVLFYLFEVRRHKGRKLLTSVEPSNMNMAVGFGLLYAVVLFAVAAAKEQFGGSGMFVVSALSGLTDMDAITLSTTQLLKQQRINLNTGWRMIMIGALSNLVFKGAIAAIIGSRKLMIQMAVFFGLSILWGAAIIIFWPKQPV